MALRCVALRSTAIRWSVANCSITMGETVSGAVWSVEWRKGFKQDERTRSVAGALLLPGYLVVVLSFFLLLLRPKCY
ncbi:hypothetical protein BDV95DRAFT_586522 [Massariosphaeria phaeospora]|uniref:Uncharacterized protein n=1 Tax=Massariosphaeria phaeospora TaxID=100035 RepID=A0A7C8HYU7_9PLEO|nr:hypothetical protein BDV95DRAFT_586522 [Massariosphaeria phaeospora]